MPGGRPKGTPKTGGRKKGSKNKTTAEVKQMLLDSLHDPKVGGVKFLVKLATEDPRTYASLLSKLIPRDVVAKVSGGDELIERIYAARDRAARKL